MQRIVLVILFCMSSLFSQEKLNIAVNDLTGQNIDSTTISILSERLRSELFKTGKYNVMERGEMNLIMQEQQFQMSGMCDEASCMVEVGQVLGVEKIISGSIGKIGDDFYTISLKTINVSTAAIENTADHDYVGNIAGLISGGGLRIAAEKLAGSSVTTISEDVSEEMSSISISTDPVGATMTMNDSVEVQTPFTGELLPGTYSLTFELTGFKSLTEEIDVEPGIAFDELYRLREVRDSEKKRGVLTRIISGTVAGGALIGGVVMHGKAESYSKDAQVYVAEAEGGDYSNQDKYDTARDNTESSEQLRNIFYGISGGAVTLFAVTFAF